MIKPMYEVRAWREQGWWLARVMAACGGADLTPLNATTHARTLTTIEQAARDLVATILDVDEAAFEVDVEYVLPAEIETLVCEAIGARTWLDAANDLWQEHSTVAMHALTSEGFSQAEAAQLLGVGD